LYDKTQIMPRALGRDQGYRAYSISRMDSKVDIIPVVSGFDIYIEKRNQAAIR
jgi:hypothetical protein